MMKNIDSKDTPDREASLHDLASRKPPGLLPEFIAYLRENRKWWLLPIVLALLLLGLLMLAGGTGAAPFIYSLF
jgi:Family of unknown function (DUF5989)